MSLDPRLLRHAVALAKYGTFSRAARMLGLTQPALSKSIRTLEELIGCELFDRDARDLCPTAAGRSLLLEAEQLLESLDDLPHELNAESGPPSGRVVLGAGQFAPAADVAATVGRLMDRHPQLEIEIVFGTWWTLEPLLRSREIDVYIGECRDLRSDACLEARLLWEEPTLWFVRRGHPLAHATDVRGDDVFRYPVAVPTLTTAIAAWLVRRRAAAKESPSMLVCHSIDLIRRVVATSDAVGAGSPRTFAEGLASGEVVAIEALKSYAAVPVSVVAVRGRPLSRAAQILLAECEAIREHDAVAQAAAPSQAAFAHGGDDVESELAVPYDRFLTPRLEWSPVLRMPTRRIDSHALDYVAALAREGSFSRAARTIGLTQSGLSKAIGSLEEKIGTPLFTRSPSGVAPTAAGEELLRRLEPLLARLAGLPARLAELAQRESGRIAIGLGVTAPMDGVVRAISRLLSSHPGVALQVVLGKWHEMEPALRAGELDLWVGMPAWATQDHAFEVSQPFEEPGTAWVRPDHPLAKAASIGHDELVSVPMAVPFLVPPAEAPAQLGARVGFVTCNDFRMLRHVAQHSDCVALMSRSYGLAEAARGHLCQLPVTVPIQRSSVAVVTLRGRMLSPAATALAADLRRETAAGLTDTH